MKKSVVIIGAVVLALLVGAGAAVALTRDSETTQRGACGASAYELSVEDDDNGLEVSFELQSRGPGEIWQVRVEQGDVVVLDGERLTDDDAELDLDALGQRDGSDTFTVTATPEAGEPCVATLTR